MSEVWWVLAAMWEFVGDWKKTQACEKNFIFNDICVDFNGRETSASSPTVPAVLSVNIMRGFRVSASLLSFSIMVVIIFNSYAQCLCPGKIYVSLRIADLESREGNRADSRPAAKTPGFNEWLRCSAVFLSNRHITQTPFGQPPAQIGSARTHFATLCVRIPYCVQFKRRKLNRFNSFLEQVASKHCVEVSCAEQCAFDSSPDFPAVTQAGTETQAACRNCALSECLTCCQACMYELRPELHPAYMSHRLHCKPTA